MRGLVIAHYDVMGISGTEVVVLFMVLPCPAGTTEIVLYRVVKCIVSFNYAERLLRDVPLYTDNVGGRYIDRNCFFKKSID